MFVKIFAFIFIFGWIAKEFVSGSFKSSSNNTRSKRSGGGDD